MSQVKMDVMQNNNDYSYNESKLFLGGLSWDTSEEDIRNYFNKFGQVVDVSIKYDAVTGNPRGFGFITFGTNECIDNVLKNGPHTLKNKVIDPKRAKSRPICKKIFVGGVDSNTSEDEIRRYFTRYGKIEGIELPYDRQRSKRREFCFIIFDTEESADAACKEPKQTIGGRECDVKKAQPQPVAQQQKRLQQQQQAQTQSSNYHGSYYGYEDGSYHNQDGSSSASSSTRPKKRPNTTGTTSTTQSADQAWNYNGNYYGSYDQYGYTDPSQAYYGYPYGDYSQYAQYYDYYQAYGYNYEGYDASTMGQTETSVQPSQHSSSSSHHQSSSSSSHHHRDSSDRKSSSRKTGSSSSYHPYRSNSSSH